MKLTSSSLTEPGARGRRRASSAIGSSAARGDPSRRAIAWLAARRRRDRSNRTRWCCRPARRLRAASRISPTCAVHVGDVVVHRARALRGRAAYPGSTGGTCTLAGSVTSGFPLRAGLDGKDLALVRDLEVEHREERLALVGAVAPVRGAAEIVPDGERHAELIVGLGAIASCSSRPRAGTPETPSRRTAAPRGTVPAARARCPRSSACAAHRSSSDTSR